MASCPSVHLGWVLYVNQVLSSISLPQSAGSILMCVFFAATLLLFLLLIQVRVISLSNLEFILATSADSPWVPGKSLPRSYSDSRLRAFPGFLPAATSSRHVLSV